jgi:hypothetical protein
MNSFLLGEKKFEDTKVVIGSRKSKKDRQFNGKQTNNSSQKNYTGI